MIDELVQQFARNGCVAGRWDLNREQLSLGGLLLLRQELELLAEMAGLREIELTFDNAKAGFLVPPIARTAFASHYSIRFSIDNPPGQAWPLVAVTMSRDFSYQFFDRIGALSLIASHPPILRWATNVIEAATAIRKNFHGKLILLHLKNVPGQTDTESNAVFTHWLEFLSAQAIPESMEFLLLGDDKVPDKLLDIPGVHSARRDSMPLAVQLAACSLSDGFLGMASGICPAAVLSKVPYVLFKHPAHHVQEMQRELGSGDHFSFAQARQSVWRMPHTPEALVRALNAILGCGT